jgi:hypothetical protein
MGSQGFLVFYLLFLTLLGNLMLWVVMSLKFRSFLIGTCWVTSWFIELLLFSSASSSRILQATVTVTARFIKQIDRMVLVIIGRPPKALGLLSNPVSLIGSPHTRN